MPAANLVDGTRKDVARTVNERDMVAYLLDRRHVVGREDDRRPAVAQPQNFLFEQIGVDRVEARKGFVEDQQFGFVQLLDATVPPRRDVEPVEPHPQAAHGLGTRQPFEPCEKERLLAHLHLLVEAALLGQVTDALHVGGRERPSVEEHPSFVGRRNAVDDADERRLSRAVGPQQSVDRTARDVKRHVVERRMAGVVFRNMFDPQ